MKPKVKVPTAQTFTRAMSSFTIVDPSADNATGFLASVKNRMRTKFLLTTISNLFADFNEEKFVLETIDNYNKLGAAVKRFDKSEIMRLCAYPVEEFITKAHATQCPLPFKIHPHIEHCKIINARKFVQDMEEATSIRTWYQISLQLRALDVQNHTVSQRVIVERREADLNIPVWRFAYLE